MKLSNLQQEVLDKMKAGWQLGVGMSYQGRAWLQKGGCGRGGETKTVNSATVWALRNKGLIALDKREFPLQTYKLV